MFAVIRSGSSQYIAQKNSFLCVEKINSNVGDIVEFNEVLFSSDQSKSVRVLTKVIEQKRMPKIIVFKKRRRCNSRTKNGHRQSKTVLKVLDILRGNDGS